MSDHSQHRELYVPQITELVVNEGNHFSKCLMDMSSPLGSHQS